MELDPLRPHNAEHPGTHSIPRQEIKKAVPVKGVLSLELVKENGMDEFIPHRDDLVKQLCLEGGSPCSSPFTKSMQSIVELDERRYPVIDDAGYHYPQDLYQDNLPEVGASPLGDHHHRPPGTKRREFYSPEVRLYYGDDILPVPWVRVFLLLRRVQPHPNVFGPHSRWSYRAM